MSSIPASQIVRILPSVLASGGNALDLNAVFLTTSSLVPIGTVKAFPDVDSVEDFFGAESVEASHAAKYFAGYNGALRLPSTLYFAQYNTSDVAAYLRSGSFAGVALTTLQGLSGVLSIAVDGRTLTSGNINLATATSFTNAAALIQTGLTAAGTAFSGTGTIDDGAGGAGNTLTVTVVNSGALKVGDVVAASEFDVGTTITAFVTGTGGLGTYTVSGIPQNTGSAAFTVAGNASVSYNAQLQTFVIESAAEGADSTIAFATGSLSAGLKLTSATGAVLSQGADVATPAGTMDAVKAAQTDWATFTTVFAVDSTDTLIAFADWVQAQNQQFAFVGWDSNATAANGDDPMSFPRLCEAAEYIGILPVWEPDGLKAAFWCGMIASIAFDQPQGRIDFAFKSQSGLVPDVTDAATSQNLLANGYNFYGNWATSDDNFSFLYRGSTPGPWKFGDSYVNQIWLNSQLQLAFMILLTQVNSLPYNAEGYNLLRNAANDPIQAALRAGVIQPGVTLSSSQRAQITAAAGVGSADAIQNNGWFLQILDAAPDVRAVRGSPPMKLYYSDGGSIQKIDLPSIAVL